jgi:hypothetical protein
MPESEAYSNIVGEYMHKFISSVRLASYSDCNDYQEYIENIKVCGALYSRLHIFEIVLRNAIDKFFQEQLRENNWTINALFKTSDLKFDEYMMNSIFESYNRKNKPKIYKVDGKYPKPPEENQHILLHDDLIGNISLGFWVSCFDSSFLKSSGLNIELWLDKILGHKFEKRKKNQKRENYVIKVLNDYKKEIQTIHNLRNRVFHFEKIYGHKMYNHSNMKDLLDKYIRKLYSTDELMDIVLKCDQP